ncbi:unnamed protein product [Schistosoma curassoni]|uniref:Uncharacterized protein n=1 Tax=Schistosoma curassoni TaxID=6186 RepID=A0A183JKI8_9TREM|nr:unnamed protein product [Schistosoma curassoni]
MFSLSIWTIRICICRSLHIHTCLDIILQVRWWEF